MKSAILALLFVIVGCGGNSPQLTPASNNETITAAQVFSNIAETWTFQNGYGDLTWIDVTPVDDSHTIWHYRKNADRAYWMPNGQSAELYFFIERDASGTWYSPGFHVIAPFGYPWDATHTPQDVTITNSTTPGLPRPYLILGDSGTGVSTSFSDFGTPNTAWITKMYVNNGFLVSEQWEGSCPTQTHERWWFKPGHGLWKVEPITQGNCFIPTDPQLIMVRVQ